MTLLTNKTIQSSYGDLLTTTNGGQGLTTTLQSLQDGFGNNSTIQIATDAINFSRAGGNTFQLDAVAVTSASVDINNVCKPNSVMPGTGGMNLPMGTTAQRLANVGVLRYNTDSNTMEYYNGAWVGPIGTGTVSSITQGANIICTPNPITTVGTVALNTNLTGLTSILVGNLSFAGNTITTTNVNGDVEVTPNGTGSLIMTDAAAIKFNNAANSKFISLQAGAIVNDVSFILPVDDGAAGQAITTDGAGQLQFTTFPVVATPVTDNAIARYDGTGGNLQNSAVIISDLNGVTGVTLLDVDNLELNGNTISITSVNGSLFLSPNGTGSIRIGNNTNAVPLRFYNSAGTFYTSLQAPALIADVEYVLPTAQGAGGTVLTNDGAGNLSWTVNGTGTVNSVNGTLNRITSTGGTDPIIDISAAYVGQASITTLGTIGTGTWQGTVVALAYGGTNANLVASNGGIFYSTATAGAILAGTATAGQILRSGSNAAPSWSTATYPDTTTANNLLYSSATNVVASLATANNGVLITSGAGVPSISSTLPAAVQGNITATGALASGSLAAGFTPVTVPLGGTGNTTFTAYSVICAGTTATGTFQNVSGVGTAGQVLTSNGAAALPTWQAVASLTGATFNTQSTTLTTTFSATSSSYTDVTGLSVSITPTSASNKVLIMASINHSNVSDGVNYNTFQLLRGATPIGNGTAAGSRTVAGCAGVSVDNDSITNTFILFIDSPATTSATTYKIQGAALTGFTFYINRSGVDTDSASYVRASSTITVMEVKV